MGGDVDTGKVGCETLITISVGVQHEHGVIAKRATPEMFHAESDAEFQRHVEARQAAVAIELDPRDVVNAEPAGLEQSQDLLESQFTTIAYLERRPHIEAARQNREDDGIEQ